MRLISMIEGDTPEEQERYRVGLMNLIKQVTTAAPVRENDRLDPAQSAKLLAAVVKYRSDYLGESLALRE
jgi:hypothetical protein